MNSYQLRQMLEAKLEYNRKNLNARRLTAGRKERLLRESTAINAMLKDIENDLPFSLDGEFVVTHSARVKL